MSRKIEVFIATAARSSYPTSAGDVPAALYDSLRSVHVIAAYVQWRVFYVQ
jgi:hypothetical protein